LSFGQLRTYTVFPNTFAQLDSIGLGILCAIILKHSVPSFAVGTRIVLGLVGLALLVICGRFTDLNRSFVIFGYPCRCYWMWRRIPRRLRYVPRVETARLSRKNLLRSVRISHVGTKPCWRCIWGEGRELRFAFSLTGGAACCSRLHSRVCPTVGWRPRSYVLKRNLQP
jgi:hypothetical protein